jgi:GWxTD domain-containing protein
MLTYVRAVLVCCALIVPQCYLAAQADAPPAVMPDIPLFSFDAVSFSSDSAGLSRFDLYIEVPYEMVRFVKDGDLFRASYDITVTLFDSSGRQLDEKWWTEKLATLDFDESVSPKARKLTERSFPLTPGTYEVQIQIKDDESQKISKVRRKYLIRNFTAPPFSISDVMLVSRIDTAGQQKMLTPNISGNVGELSNGFYLFFEAYNPVASDSAQVVVSFRNLRGDVVRSDSFWQPLLRERKVSCFHHERTDQLGAGDYTLEVAAQPVVRHVGGSEENLLSLTRRSVVVRWHGSPVNIKDLDQAIDQLQYISEKKVLDEMRDAPPQKKRQLFEEFWKKRDPTPGTERNELMEEYYSRTDYANKHFGHYVDGWKTDMGMIYIVFGAPSNIERHPFDMDSKPYEVWTYYEQNREFIFVDATGFGDYRLTDPVWDRYRQRR